MSRAAKRRRISASAIPYLPPEICALIAGFCCYNTRLLMREVCKTWKYTLRYYRIQVVPSERVQDLMMWFVRWKNLHALEFMKTQGGNLDDLPLNGMLIHESINGRADNVSFLLGIGADVHHWNDEALVEACCRGHADVVKVLLKNGADPYVTRDLDFGSAGINENSLICYSVPSMFGYKDVARLLPADKYPGLHKYCLDGCDRWLYTIRAFCSTSRWVRSLWSGVGRKWREIRGLPGMF